jgi:hypothetical protein
MQKSAAVGNRPSHGRYLPHVRDGRDLHNDAPMTDQFTSLTPAAIKEIITHIDESVAVFDKYKGRLSAPELQVKSMLMAMRRQLLEQLSRQGHE